MLWINHMSPDFWVFLSPPPGSSYWIGVALPAAKGHKQFIITAIASDRVDKEMNLFTTEVYSTTYWVSDESQDYLVQYRIATLFANSLYPDYPAEIARQFGGILHDRIPKVFTPSRTH